MGKISDLINQMFQRSLESAEFTSASPGHINNLIQVNAIESPDFEAEFKKLIGEQTSKTSNSVNDDEKITNDRIKKKIDDTGMRVDEILASNVGELKGMSTAQFGNVTSLATNPFGFMVRTILTKLRTGAGILFVVAIAAEVAKFLIDELFKPGRAFDQRFRSQIDKQIIQFLTRREQEELKSGYKSIITTTIGGLRGNSLRGQIGGNFYSSPLSGPHGIYDPSYVRLTATHLGDMRKRNFQDSGAGAARGGVRNIR